MTGRVGLSRGKVRDIYDLDSELVLVTSDRVSAYDRVLCTVPDKGEVLNQLSLFWFERTSDLIPNHIVESVSPRAVCVKRCALLPVEVVVRGYLTGSAWRDYEAGRTVSGVRLPAGMQQFERFEHPIITPSTKAETGAHDLPISAEDIVRSGLVPEALWREVETAALALFDRGTRIAAEQGLVLVDTKYEFGLIGRTLTLADEIHTPDSSRYWYRSSYDEWLAAAGAAAPGSSTPSASEKTRDTVPGFAVPGIASDRTPRQLDKEYLRRWLAEQGFTGNGEPPSIPPKIIDELRKRYATTFRELTGRAFVPSGRSAKDEQRQIDAYIDRRLLNRH